MTTRRGFLAALAASPLGVLLAKLVQAEPAPAPEPLESFGPALDPPLAAFRLVTVFWGRPDGPGFSALSWGSTAWPWVRSLEGDTFEEIVVRGPGPFVRIRGRYNWYEFTWDGVDIEKTATVFRIDPTLIDRERPWLPARRW